MIGFLDGFYTWNHQIKDSLFAGHMSNIDHMVSISKLVVAGPIEKNEKTYRGIFILDVKTFEEAEQLLEKDPAKKRKTAGCRNVQLVWIRRFTGLS